MLFIATSKSYFTVRLDQCLSSLFSNARTEGVDTTTLGRLFHQSTTLKLERGSWIEVHLRNLSLCPQVLLIGHSVLCSARKLDTSGSCKDLDHLYHVSLHPTVE